MLLTKKWFLRDIFYFALICSSAASRVLIVALFGPLDPPDMTADVQLLGSLLRLPSVVLRVLGSRLISILLLRSARLFLALRIIARL